MYAWVLYQRFPHPSQPHGFFAGLLLSPLELSLQQVELARMTQPSRRSLLPVQSTTLRRRMQTKIETYPVLDSQAQTDVLEALFTGTFPTTFWDCQDDLWACTYQRIGMWTNPS